MDLRLLPKLTAPSEFSPMAATDSFTPITSFLTRRRDTIHPVSDAPDIAAFHLEVAALLHDLSASSDDLLSINWIQKLLNTFLICQEQFRMLLFDHHGAHLDRAMSDFFDRAVKALDVLNAVRESVDKLRHWTKHADIVLAALTHRSIGEGHLRRASKALAELSFLMVDDKDSAAAITNRNRSFGRSPTVNLHFRSLSFSISRSWSAGRQIQAIGANLTVPKAQDVTATGGLANSIYTMSSVLLFVTWSLASAFPCMEGGLQASFSSVPRSFPWAAPVMAMHERIVDLSKKHRKKSSGLLKEMLEMESCVRKLTELVNRKGESVMEMEKELKVEVEELARVTATMQEELEPLERQVREVFRRIVRSRTEGLDGAGC